jgi:hypothetical protein
LNKKSVKYLLLLLLPALYFSCVQKYDPPAIQAANAYLVVDGFINANSNEATTIVLSRSRNLDDTVSNIPELNAQVFIVSNTGSSFPCADVDRTGNYTSAPLSLSSTGQYQLKIITSDHHQYLSDLVPVKISAPIDSLTWTQDSSLTIFLTTHDPSNSTRYYKWDFVETWEHYSPVQTFWVLNGNMILFADTTNQIDSCWTTAPSTNIVSGTSQALSQDVISNQPLTTILQNDIRLKARYSILARQIPLTAAAYTYWQLIEKSSQGLGTLFDLQPSQLVGNIHSISNPDEPVIGYVTAAGPQEQRIFIDHSQLPNAWSTLVDHNECQTMLIAANPSNPYIYNYPDPTYLPWYFTGNSPHLGLYVTKSECIDCREYGGVTTRPSFWKY